MPMLYLFGYSIVCASARYQTSQASLASPLALETGRTGPGAGHGPGPVPGQVTMPMLSLGMGQDRARCITSRRNVYYQTLIKKLILLLIQRMARARTGPRHSADPPPFMGTGSVWLM